MTLPHRFLERLPDEINVEMLQTLFKQFPGLAEVCLIFVQILRVQWLTRTFRCVWSQERRALPSSSLSQTHKLQLPVTPFRSVQSRLIVIVIEGFISGFQAYTDERTQNHLRQEKLKVDWMLI